MIPRIVHQIWFGPNPIPIQAKECIDSFNLLPPGWILKLWTDETIFQLPILNTWYKHYRDNPVFVADMARLEIVYHEGGFYADIDLELLTNLEQFCSIPVFLGHTAHSVKVVHSALFGAEKQHPFFKEVVETANSLLPVDTEGYRPAFFERNALGVVREKMNIPYTFRYRRYNHRFVTLAKEIPIAHHYHFSTWKKRKIIR